VLIKIDPLQNCLKLPKFGISSRNKRLIQHQRVKPDAQLAPNYNPRKRLKQSALPAEVVRIGA